MVSEDEEKEPEWTGLIVALPDPFDHEPAVEPEIAAALGMIKSTGAATIRHCRDLALLRDLRDTLPTEQPFAHLPGRVVGTVCDEILRDLERALLESADLEAEIRMTEERLSQSMGRFWSPLVLAEIPVATKYPANWQLVMRWQKWIAETGDLKELTAKFLAHLSELPLGAVEKREITAFRKKLEYLGLPASAESIKAAREALARL